MREWEENSGWGGGGGGGCIYIYIYIYVADLHGCTKEINITL